MEYLKLLSFIFIVLIVDIVCIYFAKLRSTAERKKKEKGDKLSIAFLHPDLGIGGAEKLVVEAAVGLQKKGHKVKIYTSFHDKNHSFPETNDGTLEVIVAGNWLPIHTKGLFQLPKALIRFLFVSIQLMMDNKAEPVDVLFVDQISATIPLLKLTGAKVLFYCHFPDQLLAKRESLLKKIYRFPFDFLEERTTSKSHLTLVNSEFTLNIFHDTFRSIKKSPKILYPCVNVDSCMTTKDDKTYERKKNIELALEAFAILMKKLKEINYTNIHKVELVIAGGYSELVKENVDYHLELVEKSKKLKIDDKVIFLFSIKDELRNKLMRESRCLLYTPSNEHFGICPLEAGLQGIPVIACDSGGPLESILNNVTGYTCKPDPEIWSEHIKFLITNTNESNDMGKRARIRVIEKFTGTAQADQLEEHIFSMWITKG